MTAPTLRPYQSACVDAHWGYFEEHPEGHPLFVVPTAGGKSHILAAFLQRVFAADPTARVVIATHVKELIAQNFQKLLAHWEGFCPAGIYSAGMNSRDTQDPILFCGIQSVFKRAKEIGKRDLILIDEAHLCPKKGAGMYRQFLAEMAEINPAVRVLGYTATPFRLSGGMLHEGSGRIFTDIAYEISIASLVRDGYLSPLIPRRPELEIDLTGVRIQNGEFVEGDVAKAAAVNVRANVAEIIAIAKAEGRKSWLVFASGVEHATSIAGEMKDMGIDARCVFGHTSKDERAALIDDFKAGRFPALVNMGVLTTGFDAPRVDLIALLRATESPGLYIQICGRGMRLFTDPVTGAAKSDCRLLDYGGNVDRHGPLNCITVPGQPEGDLCTGGVKNCPGCFAIVASGFCACPYCNAEFPKREPAAPESKLSDTASTSEVIILRPERVEVDRVWYQRHERPGKTPSMRVDYVCGMRTFSEWICFEHEGFARTKAEKWWAKRSDYSVPASVDLALRDSDELSRPTAIGVLPEGKFWRITSYYFAQAPAEETPF